MGQSSYNFNGVGGGGGGTNYWKIGAGGILQPDLVTYPSIAAVSMAFGLFEFYIDDTNIFAQANDGAGNSSILQIPDVHHFIITVQDPSDNRSNIEMQVNSLSAEVIDLKGNMAGMLVNMLQQSFGYRDSGGVAESLFVAFTTGAAMYVRDSGGDKGEALQTVNEYSESFNGVTIWNLLGSGEIETNQLTAGAGVYGAYSGVLTVADIGGVTYEIPYL